MMTNPIGTRPLTMAPVFSVNVGITMGGGAVKVGKRVGGTSIRNCAARVGLMVAVTFGVGVGGGSIIGTVPLSSTRSFQIQPTPPGIPGYATWYQSPPRDLPNAGTWAPSVRTPTTSYPAVPGPERRLAYPCSLSRTMTVAPEGVPVTVGTDPVGIWRTGCADPVEKSHPWSSRRTTPPIIPGISNRLRVLFVYFEKSAFMFQV